MKRISERAQRTIATPAELHGIGYLTGKNVRLRFTPAPVATGVVFVRTDLGPQARVRAVAGEVSDTERRTTLGRGAVSVSLVEHVLAALGGLRIDNCFVELDAPEPPGLDGSSRPFVDTLCRTGIVAQAGRKTIWGIADPVALEQQGATLTLHPANDSRLRASYLLDYGDRSAIMRQVCTTDVTPEAFAQEIAPCRTFVTEAEARALMRQGLGSRTAVNDLLVFGPRGPIDNHLHFANEPARHKILDLIGDLSLLGEDICGHLVAYRSGHSLNVELVRQLRRQLDQAPAQRAVA
ncbi:MAG: UDP-3-O-acyl-N-acetylglucosamine deacetylase [Gemmataceae bacterium]|nr:UDP-3-O-acyl-N-acetylglucosamine deacetylase [Gemmataceae bacterium]